MRQADHLFVGTQADNVADMYSKNRFSTDARKLTDEEAAEISERYAAGGCTQTELAREYGVSQPLVSAIVNCRVYTRLGLGRARADIHLAGINF